MGLALAMFAVVAVLAVALAVMAFTNSVIPGFVAVGALVVYFVLRTILWVLAG